MAERAHVVALLRLELERQRKLVLRLLGTTIFVGAVFWLLEGHGLPSLLAVALGTGIGSAMIVPFGVSMDRHEGTLEFLTALPTPPAAIAAARFLAAAMFTIPWAILIAAAALPLARALTPAPPVAAAVAGTLLLTWLLLTLLAWALTGLFLRSRPGRYLGYPLAVLILGVGLLPKLLRLPGREDVARWLGWLLAQPWAPAAVAAALLLLAAAVAAVSFRLAVRGVMLYRPDPTAR